jgi:hypothetical protein
MKSVLIRIFGAKGKQEQDREVNKIGFRNFYSSRNIIKRIKLRRMR